MSEVRAQYRIQQYICILYMCAQLNNTPAITKYCLAINPEYLSKLFKLKSSKIVLWNCHRKTWYNIMQSDRNTFWFNVSWLNRQFSSAYNLWTNYILIRVKVRMNLNLIIGLWVMSLSKILIQDDIKAVRKRTFS